eukprot:2608347-Pyramimonas_sp.AAC.1
MVACEGATKHTLSHVLKLKTTWKRNWNNWQACFSWLTPEFKRSSSKGLGCKICAAASTGTPWALDTAGVGTNRARPVIKQQLVNHELTAAHRSAAGGAASSPPAPSSSDFREVLQAVRSGERKCRFGILGVCKRKKMRNMIAKTISLMQDARKGKLLV